MAANINGNKRCIFEASYIEALVTEYTRTEKLETITEICAQCSNLLNSIIRGRRFDNTVPFTDLKNGLYAQLPNWIRKWTPGRGSIYSYIGSSANNACVSMVVKEMAYRSKYVATDLPLDSFAGVAEHHVASGPNYDFEKRAIEERMRGIKCRWKDRRVQEASRFVIRAIMDGKQTNRKGIIDVLTGGYDMSINMAKFLLDWGLGSVRMAVLDLYDSPLSVVDILKSRNRFSFTGDLFDILGDDKAVTLLKVFAGRTVKFPTMRQISQGDAVAATMRRASTDPDLLAGEPETMIDEVMAISSDVLTNGLKRTPLYE